MPKTAPMTTEMIVGTMASVGLISASWIGQSYYDALDNGNSRQSPMADDCERRENGFQTARNPMYRASPGGNGQFDPVFAYLGGLGCAAQMDTNMWEYITEIHTRRVRDVDPACVDLGDVLPHVGVHLRRAAEAAEVGEGGVRLAVAAGGLPHHRVARGLEAVLAPLAVVGHWREVRIVVVERVVIALAEPDHPSA